MGDSVKYHGGHNLCEHPKLQAWASEGRLVKVCPEVTGGLPTPRQPAEVTPDNDGQDVLTGKAAVIDNTGIDVTEAFVAGAKAALALAKAHNIKIAILKENSPSCGGQGIYDGHFQGIRKTGRGVTAALLHAHGISVFSEDSVDAAAEMLDQL